MHDDIIVNKIEIIKRCIKRIKEEYNGDKTRLKNFTIQDSIILNLQRACEAAIDLGMHIIAVKKLGVPQASRDAFIILKEQEIIDEENCKMMTAMIGFRNIAVHDYQKLNLAILEKIIENHLGDFEKYYGKILEL